ncbi:DUF305 domain-containing protein (plasmid) [Adhaeribacter swui]|uniref:DUF305 domain-containing protein n=2 Tax=Adhaeribacter swui TaxID=2086471 RepID=A0A7G7G2M2_9BACT|nr:DUF305 domain-containing protein [Adhaeribacter swui]
MSKGPYGKLLISLGTSFVVMYTVMFLNVDQFDHIYLSYTRFYMSLLMVSPMALLMILLMKQMYSNQKINLIIMVGSIITFVFALTALRSQAFISDVQYMKAMIPHHSSAIMVSNNANIKNPEVRKLADSIIKSQEQEIALMKMYLDRIE